MHLALRQGATSTVGGFEQLRQGRRHSVTWQMNCLPHFFATNRSPLRILRLSCANVALDGRQITATFAELLGEFRHRVAFHVETANFRLPKKILDPSARSGSDLCGLPNTTGSHVSGDT